MKLFFSFGFTVRLAIFCLLAGIGIGLYLGASAVSPDREVEATTVSVRTPATGRVACMAREVTSWSRTSTSSFCSGC